MHRNLLSILAIGGALFPGCATEVSHDDACATVAATLETCQGGPPETFLTECRTDPGAYEDLAGLSCGELESNVGKSDLFEGRPYDAACTFNLQCAGEYVCRYIFTGSAFEARCRERAHHRSASLDRQCHAGFSNADCVEGDVCIGFAGEHLGSCESESYGESCECPDDALTCRADEAGCSADLTCVLGQCRRPCYWRFDPQCYSRCEYVLDDDEQGNGFYCLLY